MVARPMTETNSSPVRDGVLRGIKYAAIVSAAFGVVFVLARLAGNDSAAAGYFFFTVLITGILALPWVVIAVLAPNKLGGDWNLLIGLFGGLFLNGIIWGYLKGASARNARRKTDSAPS